MNKKQLTQLVNDFGEAKTNADAYKKQAEGFNKQLKEYFANSEVSELASDEYRVKYSVATTKGFDEEKLLLKLKQLGATDCIKTVEVVDMNNLENAIYNKRIDAAVLADCEKVTHTEKINLYKVKKEG